MSVLAAVSRAAVRWALSLAVAAEGKVAKTGKPDKKAVNLIQLCYEILYVLVEL